MKRVAVSAAIVAALLLLSMLTFSLLRADCERRGGAFEYAVTYKTYICIGADR